MGPEGISQTRVVRRRRGLPTGRAVVGGFLVAASAAGVFVAYSNAASPSVATYVVAARDVVPGARIARSDLALVAIDLPGAQRSRSFTDVDVLDGAVALGPLARGELVQASGVARPAGGEGTAQISFSVEAGRVLGEQLKPGERVDVIVTYGSGESAIVSTIARQALLVRADAGGDGLGSSGTVSVAVAVPPEVLEDIAKGAAAGRLTIARTTGAYPRGGDRP